MRFGKCEKMGSFLLGWTVGRHYPQGRASFQNLNGLKNLIINYEMSVPEHLVEDLRRR